MMRIQRKCPSSPRSKLRGWSRSGGLRGAVFGVVLAATAAQPSVAQDRAGASLAGTSADSSLMHDILIAELAGRRGLLDEAVAGYLRAFPRSQDARVAERAAQLAMFTQAWPESQAALEHWLALNPDATDAYEMLAQVLMRQGRVEPAAGAFADGVARTTEPSFAWQRVSDLLLTDPDAPTALAVAQAIATLNPDQAQVHLLSARLALANGSEADADQSIDRALELDPALAPARLLRAQRSASQGDYDAALESLAEARARAPDDVQLQLGEAQLLVEAGYDERAREALAATGNALVDLPTEAAAGSLLDVGLLSMRIGALDDAERWFFELVQRDEFAEEATFQLARISDERGDVERAVARYEAVPAGELFISSQVRAAELRAADDDLATAREKLQTLRANVPDLFVKPQILATEGRLMQQAGQTQAAIDLLTAGLGEYPDNSALLYTRALAADHAGQSELLEADLTRLIEAEPDNAHALNALGYHLVDENLRLEEAAAFIERARELLPDDPAITDSLGWLRYRQGRFDEAIDLLRDAWAKLPDPEIARHLVEVLWRQGQEAEAREFQQQALEISPDDERLQTIFDVLAE